MANAGSSNKTSRSCLHGLTDNCYLTNKTILENYQEGKRTTYYEYECKEHGKSGSFVSTVEIPVGNR